MEKNPNSDNNLSMIFLFALTLFWSAFLLFTIQPMVGKILLPLCGGTPAVWNVCMVFFQTILLAGYLYAHGISKLPKIWWQSLIHFGFLILTAALFLQQIEFGIDFSSIQDRPPSTMLLSILLQNLGIPFLLLSATASLIQSWFSSSSHASAEDPYFLYAASNFGSLLALISYPTFFEPNFTLSEQLFFWRHGFYLLVFSIFLCALWRIKKPSLLILQKIEQQPSPDPKTRFWWFLYAFVPSSLLLGTTNYLSTDVAAIPLLWVIPLILYLVSFIFAFSPLAKMIQAKQNFFLGRFVAFGTCVAILGIILESNQPTILFFPVHLLVFFTICLLSNLHLAETRPNRNFLTEFYFWISFGGALGGIFTALISPLAFSIIAEYPLMLLLGSTFRRGELLGEDKKTSLTFDFLFFGLIAGTIYFLSTLVKIAEIEPGRVVNLFVLGAPMILAYRFVKQPRRFALGVLAVFLGSLFFFSGRGHHLVYRERTFFGTNKIEKDPKKRFMLFFHGSTLHGQQALDPRKRSEPLAYFSRESPIAQVFEIARSTNKNFSNVGIVGLGAGTLATYSRQGEKWIYYEIDPSVIRIARDSGHFSFLRDSAAFQTSEFIVGDARLMLGNALDASFDLLVLDAFSSDSIPVHLITREALQLYWSKLKPDGILVFNISSRYFHFGSLLAALAMDTGSNAYLREHDLTEEEVDRDGTAPSSWVVMVKKESSSSTFSQDNQWQLLKPGKVTPWKDDFSNIFSILF
jgi:spermidine synthase